MRIARRAVSILFLVLSCLLPVHSAEELSIKPSGTSEQMDVIINTRGQTTMGFLSRQPLDIHDTASITISEGRLDNLKDSDDGSHLVAYRRFYFFVDSTVPAYEVSLQVTPMFCMAGTGETPVKAPDINMTVGHSIAGFGPGGGIPELTGVTSEAEAVAAFTDVCIGGEKVLMDEKHAVHWEPFSIYADLDSTLHVGSPMRFCGRMKLIFTSM